MTLGPGGNRMGWGKGSGSASRPSQQTSKQTEVPTSMNRFDVFSKAAEMGSGATGSEQPPPPFGDSRRISSKSVGLPGRGSRGPSADAAGRESVNANH